MTTYKELKRQHLLKEITEEEYQRGKNEIIERMMHLYFRDYITLDELKARVKLLD